MLVTKHRGCKGTIGDRRPDSATRVAFLVRVSSDEQDERGTIENQKHYLQRKYAADMDPDSPQPMVLAAIYEEVLRAGGLPFVNCGVSGTAEVLYELGSDEQLTWLSPAALAKQSWSPD